MKRIKTINWKAIFVGGLIAGVPAFIVGVAITFIFHWIMGVIVGAAMFGLGLDIIFNGVQE